MRTQRFSPQLQLLKPTKTARPMSEDSLRWEPYDRHWIRLRGPWSVTWGDPTEHIAPPQRVTLPMSWGELFDGRHGTARFERRFQQPTNLDASERVVITLSEVRTDVSARLNDVKLSPLTHPLGDPASVPFEDVLSFDVTPYLQPTNRLTLDLTVNSLPSTETPYGLWRPVLIEVITLI